MKKKNGVQSSRYKTTFAVLNVTKATRDAVNMSPSAKVQKVTKGFLLYISFARSYIASQKQFEVRTRWKKVDLRPRNRSVFI